MNLIIDIETYSGVDLTTSGVYRYAESDDFAILLFGYSIDGNPVTVIDLTKGERIPLEVVNMIKDNNVIKWAYNAQFERICLSRFLLNHKAKYLDPAAWRDIMIWGTYLGLPQSLHQIGEVLNLERQKMEEGKDLIQYFCIPCKDTKTNGGRTRNLPFDDPQKWTLFKHYNHIDVEVESAIMDRLAKYPAPESLWTEYTLDQRINDRGIAIDHTLVANAIAIAAQTNINRVEEEIHAESI